MLFSFLALLPACTKATLDEYVINGSVMGTTYTVKAAGDLYGEDPEALGQAVQEVLDEVDAKMSTYKPESELSRFNASRNQDPFPISKETAEVFAIALEVSRKSGGAFDVTVGPLVNAWGFGPDAEDVPDPAELEEIQKNIGYAYLDLDQQNGTIRKTRPGIYCDLSAVAKGYAVDKVAELLESKRIRNYMVEVGGEVRASGINPQHTPWRIAIEEPVAGERKLHRVVGLSGCSIATSGDYRNFREVDGRRVSHTFDPRTGRPIENAMALVAVLHPSCAMADAFATALMVLGADEGFEIAQYNDLPVLMLTHSGTEGFSEKRTAAFDRLFPEVE